MNQISWPQRKLKVSGAHHPFESYADLGWVLRYPEPRHQFIDAFLRPAIHEAGQQVGKVGERIDAVQLTDLDQRG